MYGWACWAWPCWSLGVMSAGPSVHSGLADSRSTLSLSSVRLLVSALDRGRCLCTANQKSKGTLILNSLSWECSALAPAARGRPRPQSLWLHGFPRPDSYDSLTSTRPA